MRSMLAALLLTATPLAAADRALVIGIDDYSAVRGAAPLTGAAADADRMAALLTGTLGFDDDAVTVLTNDAATYDAILSAFIDNLVGATSPGDRVVFYFAGHGTTLPDGSAALVASDGDSVLGKIPLSGLSDIFALIEDRDVHVILDTGFSAGPIGARGHGSDTAIATLAANVTLWTGSDTGPAWEALGAGVMTEGFVSALSDPAADTDGDTHLTTSEVGAAVAGSMAAWCAGRGDCEALAPTLSGPTDMVWLTRETAPDIEPVLEPVLPGDDGPVTYRETLGVVRDLFAPSNEAGLTLSVSGGGDALRVGDTVTFRAEAERAGTLLLLDVDPTGALAQIYPSALSADNATRLTPAAPLILPSAVGANGQPLRIRVTEPSGQGLLLALFVEGDTLSDLDPLLPAGLSGGPVPNAGQSLFEISQGLLAMAADPARPVSWSATYLPYTISP